MDCIKTLQPGDAVLSVVSSNDIYAIIIHLLALSHLWVRNSDGIFTIPVYLYLQISDIVYNVMHIIQAKEAQYQEPMIDAILKEFLKANDMRQNVFPSELSEDGQCVHT